MRVWFLNSINISNRGKNVQYLKSTAINWAEQLVWGCVPCQVQVQDTGDRLIRKLALPCENDNAKNLTSMDELISTQMNDGSSYVQRQHFDQKHHKRKYAWRGIFWQENEEQIQLGIVKKKNYCCKRLRPRIQIILIWHANRNVGRIWKQQVVKDSEFLFSVS